MDKIVRKQEEQVNIRKYARSEMTCVMGGKCSPSAALCR